MLRRKIEKTLLDWKNTPNHKPLILKGCRQCGKTFSVLNFAKKNYEHVVYLNFFVNPQYASVFSGSLEVDHITMLLSALMGKDAIFEAGKTILILDEIQDCPDARTALKFFKLDGRYDVIGTGSLLGVKGYGEKEPKSIPVGYETVIDMTPLDFEEFLWANGISEQIITLLHTHLQEQVGRHKDQKQAGDEAVNTGRLGAGDTQKHRRGQLTLHFRLAGNGFHSLTCGVAFADTRADTGNQSQTSADRAAHEYDCSF